MTTLSSHWIALACAAAAAAAVAQALAAPATTIWRCGNSYSDTPCEGARPIEADAPPSAERRRQADEGTRRDMEAANRMQRERLRLEAEHSRRGAVVIGAPARGEAARAAPAPTLLKPGKKKRLEKPDAFVASYANPDGNEKRSSNKKKKKPKAAADGN
ncbi:hypothetical protein ACIPRI_11185 [Variovorax sp. LARHSF232]